MLIIKLMIIISGLLSLLYAMILAKRVMSEKTGSDLMQQLSASIEKGAMTFLKREYSILIFFVIIIALIIVLVRGNITGISFVFGSSCSALAGFIGMKIATKTNARTTFAA